MRGVVAVPAGAVDGAPSPGVRTVSPVPTAPETDRRRALVLGVALVVLLVKLGVAATTFGTNDIRHWPDFVGGVAASGPGGVYGVDLASWFDHHPPLIGYLLEFVGLAARHGVSVGFTLRALASLSDVASALLVFEILRRRQSARQAASGAAVFAASPVLFVISGFHGNTDPIFLMLVLLSLHLLADRRRPASAGAAVALALGVKIVPIVVVPVLLVYALTRGARTAVAFGAGFSTAFAITWLPALVGQARAVRADVLGYRGSGISQWPGRSSWRGRAGSSSWGWPRGCRPRSCGGPRRTSPRPSASRWPASCSSARPSAPSTWSGGWPST